MIIKFLSTSFLSCVLLSASAADAADMPDHLRGHAELEVADGRAVRTARLIDGSVPSAARFGWNKFVVRRGAGWRAYWDAGTKVPGRIFGPGIAAPGSMASPTVAAAHARQILSAHIDLLAPGASPNDFVLVSNDLSQGIRSIGFFQQHQGQRVIGGQVSFRFKNDRLFVIGSEALPFVSVTNARVIGRRKDAETVARAWISKDFGAKISASRVENNGRASILPLIDNNGGVRYRTVTISRVDSRAPIGSWKVYTDAANGKPVARRQTLRFATVQYNAPERRPGGVRIDYPAANALATVNGSAVNVDSTGGLTLSATSNVTVFAQGTHARVINNAGAEATFNSSLDPSGTLIWNAANNETVDAQITGYIHSDRAMAWARLTAPGNNFYNGQLQVTVNFSDDRCNAYSEGTTINFALESQQCNNTGRLPDVIYHEFGHTYHLQNIIQGVGQFDGALGEGVSDYLAATITGDPAVAVGFFKTSQPLRHIDESPEAIWPDDIGEIHITGIIVAGALWDLRKNMIGALGQAQGIAFADQVHLAITQRAVDLPSSYIEALVYDDDDGNLSNGTPNLCDIAEAFARHGLVDPSGPGGSGVSIPTRADFTVTLPVMASNLCPGQGASSADLVWKVRGKATPQQTIAMTTTTDAYEGEIPEQAPGTVVQYQVRINMANGTTLTFPNNPADPFYEFFVGEVVVLYCTDFETNPMTDGWSHGLSSGMAGEGADDWMWGIPGASSGSGDPAEAFSPTRVIGNDLGGDNFNGKYQSNKVNFATSPTIDATGFEVIRLQYQRWLSVEDGDYDQGSIYANDKLAWQNFATGNEGGRHHIDREWRFHDVDVTPFLQDGNVQIKFELASDGGLEFGGWTIDDFCIVGYIATCGYDTGVPCSQGGCGCTASGRTLSNGSIGVGLFGLFGVAILLTRRRRRR